MKSRARSAAIESNSCNLGEFRGLGEEAAVIDVTRMEDGVTYDWRDCEEVLLPQFGPSFVSDVLDGESR